MKLYCLLFLILISGNLPAVPLEGNVSIFESQEGQKLKFSLFGQTAKIIYEEMQVEPVYDACMGLHFKDAGYFYCAAPGEDGYGYFCGFGINLSENALVKPAPCD